MFVKNFCNKLILSDWNNAAEPWNFPFFSPSLWLIGASRNARYNEKYYFALNTHFQPAIYYACSYRKLKISCSQALPEENICHISDCIDKIGINCRQTGCD